MMRYAKVEKLIKKLDREIESLKIASKYLSNIDEINKVRNTLNKKRQELADELYSEDTKSYYDCRAIIRELLDKELNEEDQKQLLENIKEKFGRQSPNPTKQSVGLNAWLKELDIEFNWVQTEENSWATLIITGFGAHEK
ncbi:hypothetical protein RSJ21_08980 [Clostridium botulinum]|uniref:Uncharacterized protein n=2 Tax=Clostridium botulinum TaxID=1491 RepID=A0A6B4NPV6_CLOBO|nr:hypothetical protein [Clostridium botulinum]AUM87735.1 hypothetical protein RSJ15_08490 [Clostridium botulinum]AUN06834.1 hypothetical protein RSJ14_09005 [Clostridium botulinum]AUN11263.1 hypothetical protein RSJ6_12460 [Clostridium botulinum]AUN21592.1 hypothetical protein RSJ22_09100 [Clostridium botulinum]AUN25381.1 hypothetical protein RSJ21_08980 [Clostridium botulinum]